MSHQIQIRRDTAANWTTANPTLASGEVGFETDTRKIKIGDAATAWTSLDYVQIDIENYYDFPEITTPANPSANTARIYARDEGGVTVLAVRDSAGTETVLGSETSPGGSNTQVQYNNSGSFGAGSFFTTNKSSSVTLDGGGLVNTVLNVNGSTNSYIRSTAGDLFEIGHGGSTRLKVGSTGKVSLGNFAFNSTQTVGASEDNYVLTYDHTSGEISLEAAAGGGGPSFGSDNQIPYTNSGGTDFDYTANFTYNGALLTATNSSLLFTGTSGTTPASGSGTRLMWVPSKGAFRAGQVDPLDSTVWDNANIGTASQAIGYNPRATGSYSIAIGAARPREDDGDAFVRATGTGAIAIGYAIGEAEESPAIIESTGEGSITIGVSLNGHTTHVTSDYGVSIGNRTRVTGSFYGVAIGYNSNVSNSQATAIGTAASASGAQSLSVGRNVTVTGQNSVAVGSGVSATGTSNCASFGVNVSNTIASSTMIGYGSTARMTFLLSGNSGLNTTTPRGNFDVLSTSVQMRLTYTDNSVYTDFQTASDGDLAITPTGDRVHSNSTFFKLPVKATTGDPSSPEDGDVYVNTFDNKARLYADGAWRDLTTW